MSSVEPISKGAHVWARDGLDWYVEPRWATDGLLDVERFVGGIWDPACGGGNIVETCRARGYDARGTDVEERVPGASWWAGDVDFLGDHGEYLEPNIVMNPPFFRAKGAEAFIRKALAVAEGKVCAFVDVKFLAGAGRAAGLFAEHPPSRIWIISPRPSCPPGEYLASGGKAEGGTADWCWLVWDLTAPRAATVTGWLRCQRSSA